MNYTYYLNPYSHQDIHQHITNREFNFYSNIRELLPLELWPLYLFIFVFYYPAMKFGQKIMSSREPFSLKIPLFLWNMFVSVTSGLCAFTVGKLLFHRLLYNTNHNELICDHEFLYTKKESWYIIMFVISKYFELIDTIFLVLRKKKIVFLHWFHHLSTAIYATYALYYNYMSDMSQLWFVFMNTFVHTFMYFYYGMTAIGIYFNMNYLITLIQIIQMIIGFSVAISTLWCKDISMSYPCLIVSLLQFYYIVSFSKVFFVKYNEKKSKQIKSD